MLKKLVFVCLFCFLTESCVGYNYPTVGQQTDHLNKTLRKIQNKFEFKDLYIDLKVSNEAHTTPSGVWGDVNCDEKGCHIEILSAQGYPENFPRNEIEKQQDSVVYHEVLHLVLSRAGVPDDFQDHLIKILQPHMEGKN